MNIKLKIVDIIEETESTKSFILEDIERKINSFIAGQYLTLNINFNGELIKRSYSVSSTPDLLPLLRITIKQNYVNPAYTSFCETLSIGIILNAEPIEGYFYITEKPNINNYIFYAAGSGITPIITIIKDILRKREDVNVQLYYQNRNEESIIFYDELNNLAKKYANFNMQCYFSRPLDITKHIPQRINPEIITKLLVKNKIIVNSSEIFVCGPNNFIDMIFGIYKELGVSEKQLFREIYIKKKVKKEEILIKS